MDSAHVRSRLVSFQAGRDSEPSETRQSEDLVPCRG